MCSSAAKQALEKMLKAHVVKRKGEFPPRTHDLLSLAEQGKVSLGKSEQELLGNLSFYYIESSYNREALEAASEELCNRYLHETREFLEWLKKVLK